MQRTFLLDLKRWFCIWQSRYRRADYSRSGWFFFGRACGGFLYAGQWRWTRHNCNPMETRNQQLVLAKVAKINLQYNRNGKSTVGDGNEYQKLFVEGLSQFISALCTSHTIRRDLMSFSIPFIARFIQYSGASSCPRAGSSAGSRSRALFHVH